MKKIFAIITLVVISLVGLAQNNTVVWANGELIQDAVADSLFLYESEWADTVHLLIPKIVVREVHKTVYIHDTVYIESSGSSDKTETSGMENGHEWVDLGLSVKWATCNVGAMQPEEYGGYFAWGEVEPKTTYDWSTYKYGTNYDQLTKYCSNSSYGKDGFVDNKTELDPEDDAATANWGGAWRMPTYAEQYELLNNCTWDWTTQNGVNGYKVTGPNGNSIFLPAAGYVLEGALYSAGSHGLYWSSSLFTGYPSDAYGVDFYSDDVDGRYSNRYYGLTVRPVCE
jgi:hypothetical protein